MIIGQPPDGGASYFEFFNGEGKIALTTLRYEERLKISFLTIYAKNIDYY